EAVASGQPGPVVLGLTAVALAATARRRDGLGGAALAGGGGVKGVPLLLPRALPRRPRGLAALPGVTALLVGGVGLHGPPFDLLGWFARLSGFVDQAVFPPWRHREPAWLLRLWQARFLAPGIPSIAAALWAARTPRDSLVGPT